MPRYVNPANRASETVTFRLTMDERRLLGRLADEEGVSLTELVRRLLRRRADELGLPNASSAPGPDSAAAPEAPLAPPAAPRRAPSRRRGKAEAFRDLVERYRDHYGGRSEGTIRDLEETIEFLTDESAGQPLIPLDLPLGELTSNRLVALRAALGATPLRFAKKNLHLTYLRMMLHFGVKQPDVSLYLNPALDLKPFTIGETDDGWPPR